MTDRAQMCGPDPRLGTLVMVIAMFWVYMSTANWILAAAVGAVVGAPAMWIELKWYDRTLFQRRDEGG